MQPEQVDGVEPPSQFDFHDELYWDFEPRTGYDFASRPLLPGTDETYFDYDFDEAIGSPRCAVVTAAVREEVDLMLESCNAGEAHGIPLRTPLAGVAHYDYEYEYTFLLDAQAKEHSVLFFEEHAEMLRRVVSFVRDGLRNRDFVCLALRPQTRKSVSDALPVGLLADAESEGRLLLLDPYASLDLLISGGEVDAVAFETHVADTLRGAKERFGEVRAYGEIVNILWSRGDVTAALNFERAWSELHEEFAFAALCAYPLSRAPESSGHFAALCELHTAVDAGA